eukprot:6889046-Pyramimonas_sp.AAC.1
MGSAELLDRHSHQGHSSARAPRGPSLLEASTILQNLWVPEHTEISDSQGYFENVPAAWAKHEICLASSTAAKATDEARGRGKPAATYVQDPLQGI